MGLGMLCVVLCVCCKGESPDLADSTGREGAIYEEITGPCVTKEEGYVSMTSPDISDKASSCQLRADGQCTWTVSHTRVYSPLDKVVSVAGPSSS